MAGVEGAFLSHLLLASLVLDLSAAGSCHGCAVRLRLWREQGGSDRGRGREGEGSGRRWPGLAERMEVGGGGLGVWAGNRERRRRSGALLSSGGFLAT